MIVVAFTLRQQLAHACLKKAQQALRQFTLPAAPHLKHLDAVDLWHRAGRAFAVAGEWEDSGYLCLGKFLFLLRALPSATLHFAAILLLVTIIIFNTTARAAITTNHFRRLETALTKVRFDVRSFKRFTKM